MCYRIAMTIAANNIAKTGQSGIPTANESAILKVLAYFDIFQYPLTKAEITKYIASPPGNLEFDHTLDSLVTAQSIFYHKGFYSLHDNFLLSHRRREGNWRAGQLLPKAFRVARFLYQFPFVRAVFISGSLSKNFADEKADIDFFIITTANRLWIARTIMHLFKKLTFITGHQHYFCMNYYVDEAALTIVDKNIYTALEIATLIPAAGSDMADKFFAANNWVARFFPYCTAETIKDGIPVNQGLKKRFENIFGERVAEKLDNWLMKITTRRWARKRESGKRNRNGRTVSLLTGRHFSKSNPGSFQEKVLSLYQQKLVELRINDL